jgi:DNA-directed RNA polymerase specialized sigma24 family protein
MSANAESNPTEAARLEQLTTQWDVLLLAKEQSVTIAGPARNALALRYAPAIRSYVKALVKDSHDADELAQEVLVKILHGDFSRSTPERGRFRDLLKVAVRNLVRNFWLKKNRQAQHNVELADIADAASDGLSVDDPLNVSWRNSVLQMTWLAFEQEERAKRGSTGSIILRLRANHPDDDSAKLAERFAAATGKPIRADALRQQLRRARVRFAQLLIEEVARGVDKPTPARVEEELVEIGLIEYVRDFLPHRHGD